MGLANVNTARADAPPSRAQALKSIEQPSSQLRMAGIARLADIGTMADADQIAKRLHDDDEQVRSLASETLLKIWSRSGNKAIDIDYQRAVALMQASRLEEALTVFSDIIKKQPGFAEAWNKRATIYFMQGQYQLSLKDCDEVMKRNRNHFGALSGYGQIYIELGDYKRAVDYLEQALKVNPDLPGTAETIELLEQQIQKNQRDMI
jgi:tetratricopeptide (TPR) repeat protein